MSFIARISIDESSLGEAATREMVREYGDGLVERLLAAFPDADITWQHAAGVNSEFGDEDELEQYRQESERLWNLWLDNGGEWPEERSRLPGQCSRLTKRERPGPRCHERANAGGFVWTPEGGRRL